MWLPGSQVVEGAVGGVLFVDEAYAIVADERDHFGKEALDTLVKLTEDHRDDLVVILVRLQQMGYIPGVTCPTRALHACSSCT